MMLGMETVDHRTAAVRRHTVVHCEIPAHECGYHARIRPTLRNRMIASMLAVPLAWACLNMVIPSVTRSDIRSTTVSSYTVRPGDTLWTYAASITPKGHDVSETVAEIKTLNHLSSSVIDAGQRLLVPAQ